MTGRQGTATRKKQTGKRRPRDHGTTGLQDRRTRRVRPMTSREGPTDQAPFGVGFLDKSRGQVEKAEEEKTEKLKGVGILAFRLSSISAFPHFRVPPQQIEAQAGHRPAVSVLWVHGPPHAQVVNEPEPEPAKREEIEDWFK